MSLGDLARYQLQRLSTLTELCALLSTRFAGRQHTVLLDDGTDFLV